MSGATYVFAVSRTAFDDQMRTFSPFFRLNGILFKRHATHPALSSFSRHDVLSSPVLSASLGSPIHAAATAFSKRSRHAFTLLIVANFSAFSCIVSVDHNLLARLDMPRLVRPFGSSTLDSIVSRPSVPNRVNTFSQRKEWNA